MISTQNWIHRLEEGGGLRYLKYALLALALATLMLGYNSHNFQNLSNSDAMDAAQLARNIAEGKGYKTLFVRPFSFFLLQRAGAGKNVSSTAGDTPDRSQVQDLQPDLANPPVYPLLLAGLMKVSSAFAYQEAGSGRIWNRAGEFWIYQPDFMIGLCNQALFFACTVIAFFLARRLFDSQVAWTTAVVFLGTDLFWRFSFSGLPTMLLLLIFLALAWCLAVLEKSAREGTGSQRHLFLVAMVIGAIVGVGCLTRYAFGWLILPVLLYLISFLGQRRATLGLVTLAAFLLVVSPWVIRNYRLSHAPFGIASYAVYETTTAFPENRLERTLQPDLSNIYFSEIRHKFIANFQTCLEEELPKLGGSWVSAFFLVGLLVPFKNPALNRLRFFLLLSLALLIIAQSFGKTARSTDSPVFNSENLLVIVAPLIIIFGVSLFFTLLDQLDLAIPQFRYLFISAFCLLLCLPALINCLSVKPRASAIAYPPYYPPAIQQISGWMKENELIMSDTPWAVAWYGRRQSIWLTLNAREDFLQVHQHQKPINALYLTPMTMNANSLSQVARAKEDNWGYFILPSLMTRELRVPADFPLQKTPPHFLPEQFFITDSERWQHPTATASAPAH